MIKRYIVSTSHVMIMTHDESLKMNHAIQKDMMSTVRAVNLLSEVLQMRYTDVRLLRLSPK